LVEEGHMVRDYKLEHYKYKCKECGRPCTSMRCKKCYLKGRKGNLAKRRAVRKYKKKNETVFV